MIVTLMAMCIVLLILTSAEKPKRQEVRSSRRRD
jgi:hypothetical protein